MSGRVSSSLCLSALQCTVLASPKPAPLVATKEGWRPSGLHACSLLRDQGERVSLFLNLQTKVAPFSLKDMTGHLSTPSPKLLPEEGWQHLLGLSLDF